MGSYQNKNPIYLPRGSRVGLYGGSFNPPHAGHRHVALVALKKLGLDRVIWLVSPQNPLKLTRETAPHGERMWQTRRIAAHPRFIVSDYESRFQIRYSAQIIRILTAKYPGVTFVWIAGCDNLHNFHKWRRYDAIAERLSLAFVARRGCARNIFSAKFPLKYRRAFSRVGALKRPPNFTLLRAPLIDVSSTEIRKRKNS